jgi:hypothetical protein
MSQKHEDMINKGPIPIPRPETPPSGFFYEHLELPKELEGALVQSGKGLSLNATSGASTVRDGVRYNSQGNGHNG